MAVLLLLFALLGPLAAAQQELNSIALAQQSDHAPVLQVSSLEGYLPETASIGATVKISPNNMSESLQILVNDEDLKAGMPPATYQYILTGLGATIFAVDQRGFVYLNVPNIDADPPNPSTYQLNVQAREVETTPIRSSDPVTITIHIIDANDNSPQFEQPIYTANVTAFGAERAVVMVMATDSDSGLYGQVSHRIAQVTNDAEDNFRYDEATNMLYAIGDLMPGERYQVVVEATDGGGRTAHAIVIVLAVDPLSNTHSLAPLPGMETWKPHPFEATTPLSTATSAEAEETIQTIVTEVTENTPPNTVVVSLGGDNTLQDVYFSIAGGNEEGKFEVDKDTGTITTAGDFDRERTAMYSLQVEARSYSHDQHLYWTLVQITILDVNDNAPHFVGTQPIRLRFSVDDLDQLTANMVIGKVTVEDADGDDNGRLELRIAPPMNRLFAVSSDGVVSVNGDFEAAHFGEHQIFVIARDHGEPSRETRAEVIVSVYGSLVTQATLSPTNEVFEYTSSTEEQTPPHVETTRTFPTSGSRSTFTSQIPDYSPMPIVPDLQGNTLTNTLVSETGGEEQPVDYEDNFGVDSQETDPPPQPTETEPTETMLPTTNFITSAQTVPVTSVETTPQFVRTTPAPTTTQTTTRPLRTAPVFNPSRITLSVEENEAQMEITKVHAAYIDGAEGPITYVLQKGDASLFSVSSFTGSVVLLRPLDAEADTSYTLEVSTLEVKSLAIDPSQAHFVSITVNIADVNDWIPNFETPTYQFSVQEDTIPGTIVGQVTAFDQDRDDPNNRIRYRLVSAGGLEGHFAVNADNGLITLARSVQDFSGEKITLRVEASDSGAPAQSSTTSVLVDVLPTSSQVIPETNVFSSRPTDGQLQFSLRNYTASVAESVRPPHLVQVLSVNNKPSDTRFIVCSISSGNYRGAFGVTAGNDGNCELRTQMELDRESVERYLLNITVSAGSQTDFTLVSITVLDVNDNVPRFVYDNDLGLSTYFAGVSSTASAFTRVLTVKAEDADLGNSSIVNYSLDLMSVHSKYFTISPMGEISTKQSMSQVLQKNRLSFYEIRVSACDSPITGQQLCSKADVVINVVTESHRFRMRTEGLTPQQLSAHQKDLVRSLRQFTGPCTLLNIEKMIEQPSTMDDQARTDILWYAVNPSTKKICKKHELRRLFESSSVAMIAGKVQPWFKLERIAEDVGDDASTKASGILPAQWSAVNLMVVAVAILIALGSLIAICAACLLFKKYKVSHSHVQPFNAFNPSFAHKMGAVYMPSAQLDPHFDSKIYETQMLEMPISDEDLTMKSGSMGATNPRSMPYRYDMGPNKYGPNHSTAYEGDFSIEENMYAINVPGRVDPVTKRIQTLVIPAPDYPPSHRAHSRQLNKSLL